MHWRTPTDAIIKIRNNIQSDTQLTCHEHKLLDDFSIDGWGEKHLVDEPLGHNAPQLIEQQSGVIVFTSSVNGIEAGWNYMSYIAAKHGVIGIMRSATLELGAHNIRCHAVLPGPIDTPINDGNPARMNEVLVKTTPMRRMGEPSEIAEAVYFLASSKASFVTGTDLLVDAGWVAR